MSKEILVYCDESDISGRHFSNFYGGALVESTYLAEVEARLKDAMARLNLGAEVKWQKISEAYEHKYIELVDEIFSLMAEGKLKMRVMFTQNRYRATSLTPDQREHAFFLLYYQFVKHAFGLIYAGGGSSVRTRFYFDKLPDTDEKCLRFKEFVAAISRTREFREASVVIPQDQIAEIDSKQHVILQCLDVVLGAMQFRLNDKHREKPPGQRVRGKRTRSKERVYRHINRKISELYPNFNIGVSTSNGGDNANRWHHPYRHWLFVPAEFEVVDVPGKRKRKSPAAAT